MILGGNWCFLVVHGGSFCSWWLLAILGGSLRFLVFLGGSVLFLLVLGGS